MEDLSAPKNKILKSPELAKYIHETSAYPKEHEQLKELRETTVKKYGFRSLMNVAVDEAQFLSLLLKIMNAEKTLEIGVFTGYSLLSTALALPPHGKIIAIDVDREAYETGLPFIEKAGVDHKIHFIQADALSALQHLIDGKHEESFDFVFVDADKENYKKYHEVLLKLVKKGGTIAYDNTLWLGTVAMSEDEQIHNKIEDHIWKCRKPTLQHNAFIANDSRIESTIISIGDGVTLCRRI